jgi:hypothetical protein
VKTDARDSKATAKLWDLPDGSQVLAPSTKVGIDDPDDVDTEVGRRPRAIGRLKDEVQTGLAAAR